MGGGGSQALGRRLRLDSGSFWKDSSLHLLDGLGLRVQDSGFRYYGFSVQASGLRIQGAGLQV